MGKAVLWGNRIIFIDLFPKNKQGKIISFTGVTSNTDDYIFRLFRFFCGNIQQSILWKVSYQYTKKNRVTKWNKKVLTSVSYSWAFLQ